MVLTFSCHARRQKSVTVIGRGPNEGLCKRVVNVDSGCVHIPCDAMNLFVSEKP